MATVKIRKSVGKKGKNAVDDVKKIQELLNKHSSKAGFKKLTVDMDVGTKTIGAIQAFQKKIVGMKSPDGRVDPGGGTLAALNAKPGKAPATAEETKGAGGSSSSSSKSKPKGSSGSGASTSGGKGKRDLKTVEKELKAVGKAYEDAGDRFKAANEQIAEANEDYHARLEAKLNIENAESRMKDAIKLMLALIADAREIYRQKDENERRTAALKVIDAAIKARRCVDDLGVGPQREEDYKKCAKGLKKQVNDMKALLQDESRLDTIEKFDKMVPRIEKAFESIFRILKLMRGILATAMVGHKAKMALFEKGAAAAEKDMKKLQKEMDRLSDERKKLIKKGS